MNAAFLTFSLLKRESKQREKISRPHFTLKYIVGCPSEVPFDHRRDSPTANSREIFVLYKLSVSLKQSRLTTINASGQTL